MASGPTARTLSFGLVLAVGLVPWLALALGVEVGPGELGLGTAFAWLGLLGLIPKRGHGGSP